MLVLEIEWLTGVCRAARNPSSPAPDWPVQPDRIFSALVASWGERGCDSSERDALAWLERQARFEVFAAAAKPRTTVTSFVPPNDASVSDIRILPERRRRQPRSFPSVSLNANLEATGMIVVWRDAEPRALVGALQALASTTSYIGHSASLVRCRFRTDVPDLTGLEPVAVTAAPYNGRLAALEAAFARREAGARPRPAHRPPAQETAATGEHRSMFGRNWIVCEAEGEETPDLRAFPVIAKAMHKSVLSAYGEDIPEWVSGHDGAGGASANPHLAIVPLAFAGYPHADGALKGMALVLPREVEERWRGDIGPDAFAERAKFRRVLAALSNNGGTKLTHQGRPLWTVRVNASPALSSLAPGRYCKASISWSTVTPILLDRHIKADPKDQIDEAADIVRASCARVGLPVPIHVQVHKHPAIEGAPSAWPSTGAPHWAGWTLPHFAKGRRVFHATMQFDEPVAGPVLLGAGRFCGLGLCLPVKDGRDAQA